MDTRLLRSFMAVLRKGSITAAAAELSFVQSTVTAHVQALERMAGTQLLDRIAGGVVPTASGAVLAEHAERILDLQDQMFAELAAADERPAGAVRVCAPDSMCAYRLPGALRALGTRLPDVRLSLTPAGSRAAFAGLADRSADLAILLEPEVDAREVVDLGVEPLSLIAPPGTALPRTRELRATELNAAGVLLLEQGCGYSDEFATLLAPGEPAGAHPRFGSVETVKRCVEAGLGLALLPTVTVRRELAEGTVVELRGPAVRNQRLWLVRPAGRWVSPGVRAVEETLCELLTAGST